MLGLGPGRPGCYQQTLDGGLLRIFRGEDPRPRKDLDSRQN